jgi:hypothetical protein
LLLPLCALSASLPGACCHPQRTGAAVPRARLSGQQIESRNGSLAGIPPPRTQCRGLVGVHLKPPELRGCRVSDIALQFSAQNPLSSTEQSAAGEPNGGRRIRALSTGPRRCRCLIGRSHNLHRGLRRDVRVANGRITRRHMCHGVLCSAPCTSGVGMLLVVQRARSDPESSVASAGRILDMRARPPGGIAALPDLRRVHQLALGLGLLLPRLSQAVRTAEGSRGAYCTESGQGAPPRGREHRCARSR